MMYTAEAVHVYIVLTAVTEVMKNMHADIYKTRYRWPHAHPVHYPTNYIVIYARPVKAGSHNLHYHTNDLNTEKIPAQVCTSMLISNLSSH